jgi:hypothetical protein
MLAAIKSAKLEFDDTGHFATRSFGLFVMSLPMGVIFLHSFKHNGDFRADVDPIVFPIHSLMPLIFLFIAELVNFFCRYLLGNKELRLFQIELKH